MATMNITVPDPMRDWVEKRVASGQYTSVSDYLRDLIRHDQEHAAARQWSVEDIRRSIEEGRRQGETAPAEAVFERIEARLRAATK